MIYARLLAALTRRTARYFKQARRRRACSPRCLACSRSFNKISISFLPLALRRCFDRLLLTSYRQKHALLANLAIHHGDDLFHRGISDGHVHDVSMLHNRRDHRLQWAARGVDFQLQPVPLRFEHADPSATRALFVDRTWQLDAQTPLATHSIGFDESLSAALQQ